MKGRFCSSLVIAGVLLALLCLFPSVALAASNPYPTSETFLYNGEWYTTVPCTRVAWDEAKSRMGVELPAWGNGGQWLDNAKKAGWATGSTPRANSLAVYNGITEWGHVAYVLSVEGSTMTQIEGGIPGYGYNSRTKSGFPTAIGSQRYSGADYLRGFIYLDEFDEYANLGDDFYAVILNDACWMPISQVEGTSKIYLKKENGSDRQIWRFQRQSNGAYVISSCHDGKILEMNNGIREVCEQLTAHDSFWGGAYQQWYLIPYNGGYIFYSDHYSSEGWVMDLYAAKAEDGNIIQINRRNNSTAQIWAVYKENDVQLKGPKLTVVPGNSLTPTKFTWNTVYGASYYNLRVYKDKLYEGKDYTQIKVKSGYEMVLPAGKYVAYVDAVNYHRFKGSDTDIIFTVPEAFRIKYNANGGNNPPEDQIKNKGTAVKLSTSKPTRENYSFLGWATSAAATGAAYQPGASYTQDADLTLYAVWRPAPGSEADFKLPSGLRNIEAEAFVGGAFQYARLPEGATAIGARAFAECPKLRCIYIPESCTGIAVNAFEGDSGLTIFGVEGSYAEFFAGKYGYGFEAVDAE